MAIAEGWRAECDVCAFVYDSMEMRKRWDGHMVCKHCFEPRHIGDFYRYKSNERPLPFTRDRKITHRCYAVLSADISPVVDVWTILPLDTEIADANSEFNTTTHTFRPATTGSREFRFGIATYSEYGSVCNSSVALYKNGAELKRIDSHEFRGGAGYHRLAGMYIDSTATSTDDYTVMYLTDGQHNIWDLDSGTFLEVK